jgi:precorrin-6B methylase 1
MFRSLLRRQRLPGDDEENRQHTDHRRQVVVLQSGQQSFKGLDRLLLRIDRHRRVGLPKIL